MAARISSGCFARWNRQQHDHHSSHPPVRSPGDRSSDPGGRSDNSSQRSTRDLVRDRLELQRHLYRRKRPVDNLDRGKRWELVRDDPHRRPFRSGHDFQNRPSRRVDDLPSFFRTRRLCASRGSSRRPMGVSMAPPNSGARRTGGRSSGWMPTGGVTTLYSFSDEDGTSQPTVLVQGSSGTIFGVTRGQFSTVFRLNPGGGITPLHRFESSEEGSAATALIEAADGNLYGAMQTRGPFGGGTIYKLDASGTLTTLHAFSGADGSGPIRFDPGSLMGTSMESLSTRPPSSRWMQPEA